MASTSMWDRLTGRPRQSAAFGIDKATKSSDDGIHQAHFALKTESSVAPPRARGVDTTEGARRSKSADSEITLVEDEEEIQLFEGKGKEGATRAPSFTIDGFSRGAFFDRESDSWRMTNRELYHRLQNASRYPKSTLAIARRHLLAELHHLLTSGTADHNSSSSIMSLPSTFDEESLDRFLQQQHDATTKRYADYSARRTKARQQATQAGLPYTEARRAGCEMFDEGVEQCKRWLQQASVVKYVDGSWLACLYRNSTGGLLQSDSEVPMSEQRKAARASWLVMSEELGDGDLARSHVAIYERLMDRLNDSSAPAPKGEEETFLQWPPVSEGGNDRCWRAACVQLCLSASPCDFLPEALGFNLAYESLPYHLLVSAREIEELLDADAAYYFYLHISIDNSSSGHSAMAKMAVVDYLAAAHSSGGASLAAEMWARVRLGFALAEAIPTTPLLHRDDQDDAPHHLLSTVITMEDADDHVDVPDSKRFAVIDILKRKAKSASGLHASVQAQLAGRSISDWLDINHVEERVPLLLDALSESPLWIKRGDADESRFVRAFEWGGKMFGAFTGREVGILRDWVNSLQPDVGEDESGSDEDSKCLPSDEQAEAPSREELLDYLHAHCSAPTTNWVDASILRPQLVEQAISSWSDLGCVLYPALVALPDAQHLPISDQDKLLQLLGQGGEDCLPSELSKSEIRAILPTMLLTTSLLERAISTSCGRLATPLGMACVKILRVLLGFTEAALPSSNVEGGQEAAREIGCMGTDDLEGEHMGIWEIVQVLHRQVEEIGGNTSLSTLLDQPASHLALPALMLQLGAHVWTNMPTLLGMTSFLTGRLLDHKSVLACFEDGNSSKRLAFMACRSNAWAEYAISLGERDTRGCQSSNWQEDVDLGRRLAQNGIAHALSHRSS